MMLPLWEGFDEPFHFGYVQWLANGRGFPDARVPACFRVKPASRFRLLRGAGWFSGICRRSITYSEYFSLPRDKRAAARKALNEIRPELRRQDSGYLNYEAHHAPLAYVVLALPERMLAGAPLPLRVLALRIIGALIGGLLLYFGADRLFAEFGMRGPYKSAAVFCVFSCQMTWATVAHVANDWLALPLTVWSIVAAIRYWKSPSPRTSSGCGVLSLGLMTKAYFIALVPAAVALCVVLRRWRELCVAAAIIFVTAAPWYARNVYRYGAVTGMQESRAGIGAAAVIDAAPALDWPGAAVTSVRSALWTGNNSFTSFSARTLAAVIAVWAIALILWAVSRHTAAEWITSGYCALFVAALGYITVVSLRLHARGASGPSPWYSQVLVAPTLGLAFLGCSRLPAWGRFLAAALVALFGYVLIATYVVKLIPLYGGYEGRTSLALLAGLYSKRLPELLDNLGSGGARAGPGHIGRRGGSGRAGRGAGGRVDQGDVDESGRWFIASRPVVFGQFIVVRIAPRSAKNQRDPELACELQIGVRC